MQRPSFLAVTILSLSCQAYALSRADSFFLGIGHLDGQLANSVANGISADGTVVVGGAVWSPLGEPGDSYSQPIRWTRAEGMTRLNPHAHHVTSRAMAASDDGSVIVGRIDSGRRHRAFRWELGVGLVELSSPVGYDLDGFAAGVSDDGSIIVGETRATFIDYQATVWSGGDALGIGDLSTTVGSLSSATGVSGNGRVVVGEASHAFRWTESDGMIALTEGPVGTSVAVAANFDGSVIVGVDDDEAFRWTESSGPVGLGFLALLPNSQHKSYPWDVSADGNVVVGASRIANFGDRAFLWTHATGMVDLKEYALSQGLLEVEGWTLVTARGISADGRTIVGHGANPLGAAEGWVMRLPSTAIPEPTAYASIVFAACIIWMVRKARQPRMA